MKRLSYILPIYNVERYLALCLDSIYAQSLSEEEFEVICVDDCTPDNSIVIVKEYQRRHANIRIVAHEINKKAGGARNSGLKAAKGEYIWFVDPDDTICQNSAEILLKRAEEENLDVLSFNFYIQYDDLLQKDTTFKNDMHAISGGAFCHKVFGGNIINHLGYPVRSIYRRSLLINNSIYFPENMLYGEDTIYMAEAICAANRVGSITDYLYCYRQNASSATAQLDTLMRGGLIYQSCVAAGDLVVQLYYKLSGHSSEVANDILVGIPWFVNRLFIRLVKTTSIERANFYKTLKQNGSIENHLMYPYLNNRNKYILKHPIAGTIVLNILAKLYKIRHK